MKYAKEIAEIKGFILDRLQLSMSEDEAKATLQLLWDQNNMTDEQMDKDLETGRLNGYSIRQQVQLTKAMLTRIEI